MLKFGSSPLLPRLAFLAAAFTAFGAASPGADLASRTLLLDAAPTGQAIVAVGERGVILRSTDHARSWSEIPSHAVATLTAVSFGSERDGWAVGHDALILATHDGGLTWTKQWQGENLQDSFLDVLALDANHAIAVGAYDLYLATTDAGRTWKRSRLLSDDYHLNRISRGPEGTLYLAGEHGTLLRSTDEGKRWSPMATPYEGSFYGVLPLGPKSLLAYGLRGHIFRSGDEGASWTPVPTDETAMLATAVSLDDGRIVLAGQTRALLVSRDGGASVTRCDVKVATGIAELLVLSDGNLLAVGEDGASVIDRGLILANTPPKEAR